MKMEIFMKIYLTDLKAYNSGHLVGEWINLPIEEIELKDKIEAILIKGSYICGYNETHEEYFITDWECEFFDIKEYDNPYELNKKAFKIEELDSEDKSKMGFLLDNNLASNLDDAIEKYQNVIIYKTTTMKEVAKEYIEEHFELDNLPSIIRNNIDYNEIAKELNMNGNYFIVNDSVFEYIGN